MKTHWKKLNNPDYLGAYELMGVTDELKVKIKEVKKVPVKGADGKTEQCTVAYLEDYKPMILNTTNCKVISKIYNTPFIEDWSGKEIILVVKKVKAFGETVDALRVKDVAVSLPELVQGTENWINVKKALKNNYTLDQIKSKYSISEANEKILTNED